MNNTNLKDNFHLLLLGIAFALFLFGVIIPLSYDYFVIKKFFEGYAVILNVFIFILFTLPIDLIFLLKKDYHVLKNIGIIYLLLVVFSYIGYTISLLVSAIVSGYGIYFNLSHFIKRSKTRNP
ncbi:hypothetical protein [Flavobacterium sp. W22_SRS_FP1]|uniref:hypothetical protein n=1 Tax=Flavobacterium sp. W22_SRS_FP1 TaxID=3240276 RepID=UPI003F8DA633